MLCILSKEIHSKENNNNIRGCQYMFHISRSKINDNFYQKANLRS